MMYELQEAELDAVAAGLGNGNGLGGLVGVGVGVGNISDVIDVSCMVPVCDVTDRV